MTEGKDPEGRSLSSSAGGREGRVECIQILFWSFCLFFFLKWKDSPWPADHRVQSLPIHPPLCCECRDGPPAGQGYLPRLFPSTEDYSVRQPPGLR